VFNTEEEIEAVEIVLHFVTDSDVHVEYSYFFFAGTH